MAVQTFHFANCFKLTRKLHFKYCTISLNSLVSIHFGKTGRLVSDIVPVQEAVCFKFGKKEVSTPYLETVKADSFLSMCMIDWKVGIVTKEQKDMKPFTRT